MRITLMSDIFTLISTHERHKRVRDPVEKLYSKISTHKPQVMSVVNIFYDRLNKEKDVGKPFNISYACLSLALGTRICVTLSTCRSDTLTNYILRCGNRCDVSGSVELFGGTELQSEPVCFFLQPYFSFQMGLSI